MADARRIQRSNWISLAFPRPSVRDVPFGYFFGPDHGRDHKKSPKKARQLHWHTLFEPLAQARSSSGGFAGHPPLSVLKYILYYLKSVIYELVKIVRMHMRPRSGRENHQNLNVVICSVISHKQTFRVLH